MPAVPPSEFPPPFDPADVIGPPTDAEDERIEVGIAIVGGGPAGLACANKIMQLLEHEPELTEKLGEVPVAVIEKGKVAGAHLLSGANMKPSASTVAFAITSEPGSKFGCSSPFLPRPRSPERTPLTTRSSTSSLVAAVSARM